jgi:D-alanyl-D-alanine carboxypeptidase
MREAPAELHNGSFADAIPAALASARRSDVSRRLARAQWLLRRKSDGRYLATADRHGALQPLLPLSPAQQHSLVRLLAAPHAGAPTLALDALWRTLAALGIDPDYAQRHDLAPIAEPRRLAFAGRDRYHRPLWLLPAVARAWQAMQAAAQAQGVSLVAISGFRSHAYQLGIFRRKQARGLSIAQILAVNAAPGFSEHHGGFALDIGTVGEPPAETTFEHTQAFAWLCANAARFGFTLSYPRDNPHGIVYEPWHWAHRAR